MSQPATRKPRGVDRSWVSRERRRAHVVDEDAPAPTDRDIEERPWDALRLLARLNQRTARRGYRPPAQLGLRGARFSRFARLLSSGDVGRRNATLLGIEHEILEATDASDTFATNKIRQWRHGRRSLTPRRSPRAHVPGSGSTPGNAFGSRVPKNAGLRRIVGRTFRNHESPASPEGRA